MARLARYMALYKSYILLLLIPRIHLIFKQYFSKQFFFHFDCYGRTQWYMLLFVSIYFVSSPFYFTLHCQYEHVLFSAPSVRWLNNNGSQLVRIWDGSRMSYCYPLVVNCINKSLDRSDLFTYPTNCGEIDTNVVILRLNSGSYLRFRINSGAQCNVVLISIYETHFVTPVNTSIVAYGGSKLPLIGEYIYRGIWWKQVASDR